MIRITMFTVVAALAAAVIAQIGITERVSLGNGLQTNDDSGRIAIGQTNRFVVFESDATNIVLNDTNGVSDIFLHDVVLGTTERVSISSTEAQSNGASFWPDVSADGRYVIFQSAATNLVPGDTNAASDIFIRDRQASNTFRISVSGGGVQGNAGSSECAISDDGEYAAYVSSASNLVAGDTNGVADAFRYDIDTGAVLRVSLTVSNLQANGSTSDVAINDDGDFIAFSSSATNLVIGDTNGVTDVFRREISNPSTTRISRHTNGAEGNGTSRSPSISASGQVVAFRSAATNLVSGDTNGVDDVFVRNVGAVTTVRASVSSSNAQGNGASLGAAISADARYVAFQSSATDLVTNDTNGQSDVFRRDLQTGTTVRASLSTLEVQGNGASNAPSLGDGTEVAFLSAATNLLIGDTNAAVDGFLRDVSATATAMLTVTSLEGNEDSYQPVISAGGRHVAFSSWASNLVTNDTNNTEDIFVFDRLTRTTARVSLSGTGAQGDSRSLEPEVSADGRYVAFQSFAANLVPGDTNGDLDIFVRDRLMNTTTRVSVASNGTQANAICDNHRISADGRYVTFSSLASSLVPNDTNGVRDVFVHDRVSGQTTRVSVATGGAEANGESFSVGSMSADGNIVVFHSDATNLVAGDTNGRSDIFLRNLQTGVTQRVSLSSAGAQGNGTSTDPDVSQDGRFVTFTSGATNLVAGDTNAIVDAFRRDVQSSTTIRVSISSAGAQADMRAWTPRISAEGDHVTFHSSATNLVPGDTNGSRDVFVRQVGGQVTYRVSMGNNGIQGNGDSYGFGPLSKNGLVAVFFSDANNLVELDSNGFNDAFVHDSNIRAGSFSLVRGVIDEGTPADILFSDDERLVIRPGITFTTTQTPIEFTMETTSPVINPSQLVFAVEFNASSQSVRQTIEMFNFDTQAYELVDTRQATLTDDIALVAITSNSGRFVSSNGLMRSRVSYKASGPVFAYPWRSRVDHIRWTVY